METQATQPAEEPLHSIGLKMMDLLKTGGEISDELYVEAVVAKLRLLFPHDQQTPLQADDVPVDQSLEGFCNQQKPAHTPYGWVLVGFPWNIDQAALLETVWIQAIQNFNTMSGK